MLAEPRLAMLTGYKLIADLGNQNKTCDNKALSFFCCRMRSGVYSNIIETKMMVYKIAF